MYISVFLTNDLLLSLPMLLGILTVPHIIQGSEEQTGGRKGG